MTLIYKYTAGLQQSLRNLNEIDYCIINDLNL
jgi:hypothetical protein